MSRESRLKELPHLSDKLDAVRLIRFIERLISLGCHSDIQQSSITLRYIDKVTSPSNIDVSLPEPPPLVSWIEDSTGSFMALVATLQSPLVQENSRPPNREASEGGPGT